MLRIQRPPVQPQFLCRKDNLQCVDGKKHHRHDRRTVTRVHDGTGPTRPASANP